MKSGLRILIAGAGIISAAFVTYTLRAQAPVPVQQIRRIASNKLPKGEKAPIVENVAAKVTHVIPPQAPAVAVAPRPGSEVLINRETYAYAGTGRRDPFVSLMNTEELRPLLTDLKLVAVALDPTGRNSVAVLRDMSTKEQYRVKVGQELGRMRVAAIHEKDVVFGIEEFGYSRQEMLAMSDSTKVRTQ
jgi:hypothetical protein